MYQSKPCPDPVVEHNVAMLRARSEVGLAKYGTSLANNPLTHRQWLQHALEEALDFANYLQAAIHLLDKQADDFK